jgi:cell division protein FtsL
MSGLLVTAIKHQTRWLQTQLARIIAMRDTKRDWTALELAAEQKNTRGCEKMVRTCSGKK